MQLFLTNVHGERTRDEALGMSEWEARNRLYQYMGWKNLVSTLNMGSSYCSHFSLLVTPTATHNATTNLHVPFTVGSQIREPSVVDDTDFQYDWFTLSFWPGKNVFLIFPLRGQDGIFYFFFVLKKSERFARDHVLRSPFACTARFTISGRKPSWIHVAVV